MLIHTTIALLLLAVITNCAALSTDTVRQFQPFLTNKMILAPLTKGGNLPFRRLCTDFGMETSISEMIYARGLLKGSPVENARLRRSEKEQTYGVQIATNQIEEGLNAIQLIRGADFIDLNCGCPIYDVTRRGLGSSLLRSPSKLHKLVKGLVDGSDIPVTAKIRLGCEDANPTAFLKNVEALCEAGVSAITIHGRTAQQRYSKDADWEFIKQAVIQNEEKGYGHIPIIGNGDILTHYEARRRMKDTGVHSVMVGRGALMKPWIFKEFNDNAMWLPTAKERVQVYRTLAQYMKEHFGGDDIGRKRAWTFLPWHLQFLSRYCPYPEDKFKMQSAEKPLIQSRLSSILSNDPLDNLLASRSPDVHSIMSTLLWESDSDAAAIQKLEQFAVSDEFTRIVLAGNITIEEDVVLANAVPGKTKRMKRQVRKPGPKRTEEEITSIRAKRAKKKEMILARGGVWPPN